MLLIISLKQFQYRTFVLLKTCSWWTVNCCRIFFTVLSSIEF